MKISLNWLKMYVDMEEDPYLLAGDLTMFGLNVEGVERRKPAFEGLIFGRVLDVKKHPNADRLNLCRVDAGCAEPLQIVCGAQNVRAGMGVVVAAPGASLPGGVKIKRSKIRGVVSEGMICSEAELGLGEEAEGILELEIEAGPGEGLEDRLGEGDFLLDIEVTPNRPDLLCHIGVAREIAAMYRRQIRYPRLFPLDEGSDFRIEVKSASDCPRYSAAFVEDVNVSPSPDWMQKLLAAVGLKPINNIVDITNFVLMELGQPLHAFDRDRLKRDTIIVRRAQRGEKLVTLDGVGRELERDILVIADGERPVALAGVIGGKETEVTGGTRRVLLESATFDRRRVRAARHRYKLDTEASFRFEREADIGITVRALQRVCQLIKETGAGRPPGLYAERVASGAELGPRSVVLRVSHMNRVMGTSLASGEIATLLDRLELKSRVAGKSVQVSVPTFRRDVNEEIDVVEEAARVYGYENIRLEETARCNLFSNRSADDIRYEDICDYMTCRGFAEVLTSSFMDPADPLRMGFTEGDARTRYVRIANPLTDAQAALRTSMLPGLLNVVRRNVAAEQEGIRIFELGKIFIAADGGSGLPKEELHITALFSRMAVPLQWTGGQRNLDFFDMKGELEELLHRLGAGGSGRMEEAGESGRGYVFRWFFKDRPIAECGSLSGKVTGSFDIDENTYFFDILLDALPKAGVGGPRFMGVSPYPAVKRDLCVVASEKVTFAEIEEVVMRQAKYLDSIKLFDYYLGGHLGKGKRSYTFRLSFRSPGKTLDDRTVDGEIQRILEGLQDDLQVVLRK